MAGSVIRPLDQHLNDVIVGILKLSTAVKVALAEQERLASEAREHHRRLEQAQQEQLRLAAALAGERARVQLLRDQAARWRESENLRLFVLRAREVGGLARPQPDGPALDEWAGGALQQADRLDPFTPSPPSILDDAERIEHMCDGLRGAR